MSPAGIVLTGGSSSRMGVAKATLLLGGETLAARAAAALAAVCDPVVEVGPGVTDLRAVPDEIPGAGPLAGLVTGSHALGSVAPVILLACDLPRAGDALLGILAAHPGDGTVVPVDSGGRPQPVCARYSRAALARAEALVAAGERALQALLREVDVTLLREGFDPQALMDVDTPGDARRMGIEPR